MIYRHLDAIFFHVGKTAGNSVERMLVPVKFHPTKCIPKLLYGWDSKESIYLQHASCVTVRRLVGAAVFDACFKFTVVRNPFTRIMSVYSYNFRHDEKRFKTFKSYVHALPGICAKPKALAGSHHIPQIHYSHIDGRQVADHIARFEDLPDSLDAVRRRLGIDRELPHINVIPRLPEVAADKVAELYDPRMVAIMREVFAADFETFGYSDRPDDAVP